MVRMVGHVGIEGIVGTRHHIHWQWHRDQGLERRWRRWDKTPSTKQEASTGPQVELEVAWQLVQKEAVIQREHSSRQCIKNLN